MMGENPNYWWSLNGKLQPPPSQLAYNQTSLSTPPLQLPLPVLLPVTPPSSILNPPYLFGSSLLVPAANPNPLADHHHQENQDFPVSWSHLLLNGLANDQEQHNLGAGHAGDQVKYGYLDNNQQSRQLYYSNKNDHHANKNTEDDLQACSSSWTSSQLPSVGSSSTMNLSTATMFDFSSKIDSGNQHTNQYSYQYDDDTSTSGVSKKPRFQSSSTRPSSMESNDTFTSGITSKRSRAQHSSTQTPLKVRKEKLGDRISALHQLVSPFGKTDTASVLFEATAQIRFLESQIEALSSPYMNLPNNVSGGGTRHQHTADGSAPPKDLASRGLCLVPVTFMDHIDSTNMTNNGAEFWTPALGGGF